MVLVRSMALKPKEPKMSTMTAGDTISRRQSNETGLIRGFSALMERRRERRLLARTHTELHALPDSILRDIGIERSEISGLTLQDLRDRNSRNSRTVI